MLPVTVSPESSIFAQPTATAAGTFGALNFYVGGNPNLASITGNKWLLIGAGVLAALWIWKGRGRL